MDVSYCAFIGGRLWFSNKPIEGSPNTVFQIEDGTLFTLRDEGVERIEFEEAD